MPRILVAVTRRDGDVDVVNVGRPAALVAFGDEKGKTAPDNYGDFAWLAHRALGIDQPLGEWLDTLEDLDASDSAVAAAERKVRERLEPHELLESLRAAELVELFRTGQLGDLVEQADDRLAELRREAERDEQADEHNAEVDQAKARKRLDGLTEAELEAMPRDELDQLHRAAGLPVPTTAAPATAGGGA